MMPFLFAGHILESKSIMQYHPKKVHLDLFREKGHIFR